MIKRRFHITTTASRKRTRINPKLNRIRKQREKAEMYSDMMSDTQLAQPPQLHVHGDIAFDPYRDEAVLAMGNIGGGEIAFSIADIPEWITLKNQDGLDYDLLSNEQTARLGPHQWIALFLTADESGLPLGPTVGTFKIASTGGNAFVNAHTDKSSPDGNPANMAFSNVLDTSLTVNWINACTNANQVNVYRNTSYIKPPTAHHTINDGTANTFNDTGLTSGQQYYYWVDFENLDGKSSHHSSSIRTMTPPDRDPSNLVINAITPNAATISWSNACNNEENVRLFLATSNSQPGSPQVVLAEGSTTTGLSALVADTTYYVWIDFINAVGTSNTITSNFTTPADLPDADPTNMSFGNISNSSIRVLWDNNATNETGVTIWHHRDDRALLTLPADTTSYTFTNLSPDTSYTFNVRFDNAYGSSNVLTGSSSTTGQWVNTQIAINAAVDPLGTVIDMDAHSGESGIYIGDMIKITNSGGKVEEMAVTDVNVRAGTVTVTRGLNQTKALTIDTGSTVEVNHQPVWTKAGESVQPVRLATAILSSKVLELHTDVGVDLAKPLIEKGNYIKIDNEIMGPVTAISDRSNLIINPGKPKPGTPIGKPVVNQPVHVIVDPVVVVGAKPVIGAPSNIYVTVAARGVLGTIPANHIKGAFLEVNHK